MNSYLIYSRKASYSNSIDRHNPSITKIVNVRGNPATISQLLKKVKYKIFFFILILPI